MHLVKNEKFLDLVPLFTNYKKWLNVFDISIVMLFGNCITSWSLFHLIYRLLFISVNTYNTFYMYLKVILNLTQTRHYFKILKILNSYENYKFEVKCVKKDIDFPFIYLQLKRFEILRLKMDM